MSSSLVLRPGNSAQRAVTPNSENMPPAPNVVKGGAGSRLRQSLQNDNARRRRQRSEQATRNPKLLVTQAKKRRAAKVPQPGPPSSSSRIRDSLRFTITSSSDVVMNEAAPASKVQTIPITLPKHLPRPDTREVSMESLVAAFDLPKDMDPQYMRDTLAELGPPLLSSLSSVKATAPTTPALPAEMEITVADKSADSPSHMIAIFSPPPRAQAGPSRPRKVTLYPIHDIVLAAHCANLPPFSNAAASTSSSSQPETSSTPSPAESSDGSSRITVPVRSLCLPAADSYPHLAAYLYNHNTSALLNSMLPSAAPPAFEDEQATQIEVYAKHIGRTFTFETLLMHTMKVHGMWQNACALGVVDEALWDTIELAWETMLTCLAISSGRPQLMISPVTVV